MRLPVSEPPIPAKNAPTTNDIVLALNVSMPIAFAATSSSRTARSVLPKLLESNLTITYIVKMHQK